MEGVQNKSVKTTFWALVEKVGLAGVQFVIGIILARLLTPYDYGVVALLIIFIAIGQVFVDSGFGNALIRKNKCDEGDYSTAFYFNFAVSIGVYLLIFFLSPLVADFYKAVSLKKVLRVYGLCLIINSLTIVHIAVLTRKLAFKTMAKCRVISSSISGAVSIYFAYYGWGVWALVYQTLISSFLYFAMLFCSTKWKPHLLFSNSSFNYLWGFGSKMLLSGLISSVYSNLYSLLIGRYYKKEDLGFFNRGQSLASVVPGLIKDAFGKSTYPLLSECQENIGNMIDLYRKYTKIISLISFPIIVMAFFLSKPLIILLLTEKWEGAIFFMQIFSIAALIGPIGIINMNVLMALGRSDIMLKADIIKKTLGVVVIFILVQFSVQVLAIGNLFLELFIYSINLYFVKKVLGIQYFEQIKDVVPYFSASLVMGIVLFIIIYVVSSIFLQLLVGTVSGILIYSLVLNNFLKDDLFKKLLTYVVNGVKKSNCYEKNSFN